MIIAIDPGKTGGISSINKCCEITAKKMPDTEADIIEHIRNLKTNNISPNEEVICYLEEVGGYIGGKGQPGSRMFNFGCNYGFVKATIMNNWIPLTLVKPSKWIKYLGLGKAKGESSVSKTKWKNKLKARAQEIYPGIKVTLAISDSLLILKYANLVETGRNL